jgi:hypothetical protein
MNPPFLRPLLFYVAVFALEVMPAELVAQQGGPGAAGTDWKLWISLAISLVALGAAAMLAFRSMRGSRAEAGAPDPMIVFPFVEVGAPMPQPGVQPLVPQPPVVPEAVPPMPERHAPAAAMPTAEPYGRIVEGATIRFYRPPEGSLQFLPGRLEVVAGGDQGNEIRFVRPREGEPEVSFGRREGIPHRHVQLLAGTVSREHARMHMRDGHWEITNLSRTNPVAVNGEELPIANGGRALRDGDRIDMGEVVFQYRER